MINFIAPLMLFIVGLFFLFIGLQQASKGKESREWPHVTGEVLVSKVEKYSKVYMPEIEYKYDVNDQSYRNDTINFGNSIEQSKSLSYSRNITKKFPKGERIKVYYDPESPEVSVLIPGGNTTNWYIVGFGALLCFWPLIGLFSNIRGNRKMNLEI